MTRLVTTLGLLFAFQRSVLQSVPLRSSKEVSRPSPETTRSCWEVAAKGSMSFASLEIQGAPLTWPADQDRLPIRLRFVNRGTAAVLLNKRASIGVFPGRDTDISISLRAIAAPAAKVRSPVKDIPRSPELGDYALVPPGNSLDMRTTISRYDYVLGSGEYELRLCLWDRNPKPPEPSNGVIHFDHPLPATPVRLIVELKQPR